MAAFDCGRILNPELVRSQVMGASSSVLLERVLYDDNTAQLIGEYYVPTHADRPEFDISFIDNPDYALNPIEARGVGESASAVRPQPSPPPLPRHRQARPRPADHHRGPDDALRPGVWLTTRRQAHRPVPHPPK